MGFGEEFPEVLTAARLGAEWAWRRLYSEVAPSVLGYVSRRGAPDPEDITGQVFLDVVRGIESFDGGERDFRAWVLTIAHRRFVDALRAAARDLSEPTEEIAEEAVPPADAETEAMERIQEAEIRALIGSLAPDQADVLLLRLLGQMTIDEIAQVLGKRRGAVKALQRRGLAALKRKISSEAVPL